MCCIYGTMCGIKYGTICDICCKSVQYAFLWYNITVSGLYGDYCITVWNKMITTMVLLSVLCVLFIYFLLAQRDLLSF